MGRHGEREAKPFVWWFGCSGNSEAPVPRARGLGSEGRDSELAVLGKKRCPEVFPEVCSSQPLSCRQPVDHDQAAPIMSPRARSDCIGSASIS